MISIALATYNGAKYLRQQLDSIYAQTYRDIEVIACDDCSADETVSILEEYENKYGLRLYCNEKNLGYIKNFEKAISLCSGKYISLSDQDDIWMPQKLEVLKNAIGENLLIFSDMGLINEAGVVIARSAFHYFKFNPERARDIQYMAFRNYVTGCTVLFKKELLFEAMPFSVKVPHDYWLAMFALNKDKIIYTPDQLVNYRQHSTNQIGMHLMTLSNTVNRIIGIKVEVSTTILVSKELASCEKFRADFKQTLSRAALIYEAIISNKTHFIIKCFYWLKYFKYLSTKSLGDWIILRILQRREFARD
jgi:glycosyltransferase involved in cell wall biosynthesis